MLIVIVSVKGAAISFAFVIASNKSTNGFENDPSLTLGDLA